MSDVKSGETWLVVASTGAALVNLVAAAVTGLARYDRVLFLIGINPNGAGKRSGIEADRGYGRLLEALDHEARRIAVAWPKPDELVADMNDPSPWTAEVERFFGAGGQGQAARHIVYVYTGGTKDMTVGCWEGFAALKCRRADLTIELVSKQEERVFWPRQQRSVWLRGGGSHISVEGYLLANGYRILKPDECAARRAFALAHAEPLSGLGVALLGRADARRQQWVKLLNRLSQHSAVEVAPIAASLPAVDLRSFCSTLQPLLRALSDGGCTLSLSNGRWMFRRREGVPQKRFQGDWFEDWLFLRAYDAVKHTGAEVLHALKIVRLGAVAESPDNEIDLAILANDQLYIAEAKTAAPHLSRKDESKDATNEIRKLSALRKQVVGPSRMGRAWLVSAEEVADDASRREIGENLDVEVVAGRHEIEALLCKLPEIIA